MGAPQAKAGARDADPKSLYALMKLTAKMLGDAGEHYVVSQIAFAGLPATKMPDGWEAYDLAVETGKGLIRVSVKTRSETQGWRTSRWFSFDERRASTSNRCPSLTRKPSTSEQLPSRSPRFAGSPIVTSPRCTW